MKLFVGFLVIVATIAAFTVGYTLNAGSIDYWFYVGLVVPVSSALLLLAVLLPKFEK